jgi:hypothetical protein
MIPRVTLSHQLDILTSIKDSDRDAMLRLWVAFLRQLARDGDCRLAHEPGFAERGQASLLVACTENSNGSVFSLF